MSIFKDVESSATASTHSSHSKLGLLSRPERILLLLDVSSEINAVWDEDRTRLSTLRDGKIFI